MNINIIPLQSAIGVKLASSRSETRKLIGLPSREIDNVDYYQFEPRFFSVHYDASNLVEFIEISNPHSEEIEVLFNGINVFEVPARELIQRIELETGYRFDRNDPELEYSYIFRDLDLSFWRPTISENDEDEDGKFFETIGIGIEGYYD